MRHNIVSVSGGKDSTALLLLALERNTENLQAVFADTGNEHPITYEYVQYLNDNVFPIRTISANFTARIEGKRRYVAEKWPEKGVPQADIDRALEALKPTGNAFLDLCMWKGRFPSSKSAFCSEELKRNPIIEQVQMHLMEQGHEIYSWQGVRRDESIRRRHLAELEEVGGGLWNYRPILDWTAQECFEMHRKHGIKHNPLYEQGMGRVGCMPCINCRKDELLEISKRFPEEIKRIATWERIIADACKRGSATFFPVVQADPMAKDLEIISPETHGVHVMVEWAKTSHGGKQYDLLRVQDDGPTCSSIYGLCE
jgi:3'-phosphoadenosine 5'-phosphosulfate sulfotransferase (PAPS reductase)/FAD synthetase